MSQTIPVSISGEEYTWPVTITEKAGKDISGVAITVALGTFEAPGTWKSPTETAPPTLASRVVQLLVDTSVAPGEYYLWSKAADSPEIVIRRHDRVTVT